MVLWAEHLIHEGPNYVNIFVANLNEDTTTLIEQLARYDKPIT
jgi:hypothetical protein